MRDFRWRARIVPANREGKRASGGATLEVEIPSNRKSVVRRQLKLA
jgi:hypothetical protein